MAFFILKKGSPTGVDLDFYNFTTAHVEVYNCTFSFTTAQTGHNCPLKYTLHYAEEMTIKAIKGEGDGIKVGCKFLQDVRFTDDHGMVADTKSGLQKIMERLSATAE